MLDKGQLQLLDPLEERCAQLDLRLEGEVVVVDRRNERGLVLGLRLRLGLGPRLWRGVGLEEDIVSVSGFFEFFFVLFVFFFFFVFSF